MNKLAIIPARGGSKRMPQKNVIDFLGKPIIAYTIEAAYECGIFQKVVVSTEDEKIASIAEDFGADVEIRPERLATDTAKVKEVCLHFLDLEESRGRSYDIMCCLYATAPLRFARDIRATVDLIEPGVCDFAMAVTDYSMPPYQAMQMDESGLLVPMWPELVTKQNQEIGTLFIDNGSTYAVYVPAFRKCKSFRASGAKGYFMPRSRSVDIDTEEDLEMALYFARKLIK